MRKNIVAGNWKMNTNTKETKRLVKKIRKAIKKQSFDNTRIVVAPPFVNLTTAVEKTEKSVLEVSAQNMHHLINGAFTGEISGNMLKSIGVNLVIIGHSERRAYFNEDNALLKAKVDSALKQGIEVIFCFGEELRERKNGTHFEKVKTQLLEALGHLTPKDLDKLILAYEPVWAIGTGETATPGQAQEMHAFVRGLIADNFDSVSAENISILYGGSVKPSNSKDIFSKPDVDGGLIGGASLKAEDFVNIINSFE